MSWALGWLKGMESPWCDGITCDGITWVAWKALDRRSLDDLESQIDSESLEGSVDASAVSAILPELGSQP